MEKMLLHQIERLREQMFQFASVYGFTDRETVKVSQQLDRLLNIYSSQKDVQRHSNH